MASAKRSDTAAMSLGLLFAILLFSSSLQASAFLLNKCPAFSCEKGSYTFGYFVGKGSDGDSPDLSSRLLTQAVTSPNIPGISDGGSSGRQVLASLGTDVMDKCVTFCENFNKNAAAAGGDLASFWTFWLTVNTDDNGGGNWQGRCLCYAPDVCTEDGEPVYNDRSDPLNRASTSSVFVTGTLCVSSVVGDPHFTGADKSYFDFTGLPNHHYALLSDRDLQVNAFFGGRYEAPSQEGQPGKPMTWMRKVGVVFRRHSLVLEAREGPQWQYGSGYMQRILVDNHPVNIDSVGESADFTFADGTEMKVTWVLAEEPSGDDVVDKYEVRLGKQLTMILTLRPEVSTHRTPEDGLVHFGVSFADANLSPDAHGVLGQTYRREFAGRLQKQQLVWSELLKRNVVAAENGEGFLDGSHEDYLVSSLLSVECEVCRFRPQLASSRKMLIRTKA